MPLRGTTSAQPPFGKDENAFVEAVRSHSRESGNPVTRVTSASYKRLFLGENGPAAALITNTAHLVWAGPTLSDSAAFEAVWTPLVDPGLTKTAVLSQVLPGEPLSFSLAYANPGDYDLLGAVLSDVLPAQVSYLTSTPPGVYQNGTLTWSLDVPAGGSGLVTVTGLLSPSAQPGTTVSNTAYLAAGGITVSDTAAFRVARPPTPPSPALTKTVTPTSPLPGQTITFSLAYANSGETDLLGAVLSDVLPAQVSYLTATPPGVYQNGTLTWSLDVLAGGSGLVTVTGLLSPSAQPDTTLSNTAHLAGGGVMISATASFRVARPLTPPAPSLTKTVTPTAPLPGQTVTFSLAYANSGETDLLGAVLSDALPAQVSYLTATPPGVYRGGVLTWSLDVPAGGADRVTVVARLDGTALPSTTVSNTAHLSWSGGSLSATAAFRVGWTPADDYQVYLPCILKD